MVQIEVAGQCHLDCIFCPVAVLEKDPSRGNLSFELYESAIAPGLEAFDLVYLQGWGEPLLHPNFWEMISLAQDRGCRTGFTTNGAMLHARTVQMLLDTGVDILSVSFAGAKADTHTSLRRNSNFEQLCQKLETLSSQKQRGGYPGPWLELHFLMTQANLQELPDFVKLAKELGADEVVATNLAYTPTLELDRMRVFDSVSNHDVPIEILVQTEQIAKQAGIPFRSYPLVMDCNTLVCDSEPGESLYISHKGETSPCVFLGLNPNGEIARYFQGESHPTVGVSFGHVSQGLAQVLEGPPRRSFLAPLKERKDLSSPWMHFSIQTDWENHALPPPPEPCRYCYKMYGV